MPPEDTGDTHATGMSRPRLLAPAAGLQAAGAWHRLHALLLAELRAPGRLELTRAIADSAHVRALKGAGKRPKPGRPGPDPSITS
jgi:hypothetical protein